MSIWSGLWVGDGERIGTGLVGDEVDEVALAGSDTVLAHVDLPGVLPPGEEAPGSADRLTAIACEVTGRSGRGEISFAEACGPHLAGGPDDAEAVRGAFAMSRAWVELFAGLDEDAALRIGQRWGTEAEVPVESTTHVVDLVRQIRDACRLALERGAAVVYSWTL